MLLLSVKADLRAAEIASVGQWFSTPVANWPITLLWPTLLPRRALAGLSRSILSCGQPCCAFAKSRAAKALSSTLSELTACGQVAS
ncbi:hypothetical protein [Reyranella sp.]|uniref:hypothetical protein n=1 Tax=Reyranella sp. TaxID=1929291 RepID=UPI0025FC2689|nr:hypothetical protein [Reyranella sp.]